jgi:cytochrome c6
MGIVIRDFNRVDQGDPMRQFIGRTFTALAFVSFFLIQPLTIHADDASTKIYQSKCSACHGADGSGNTPAGKALKVVPFNDPDVQKQTDADLMTIIAKGKNKMPGYEKSLKPEEIKGVLAHVRDLGKK